MIKDIRLTLEYNTYCLWLYDENGEIIDNDNPPEWIDDLELTNAFMAVSDIYDTFFVDNETDFYYVGYKTIADKEHLISTIENAVKILINKNAGKYNIINNIDYDQL